MRLGCHGATLVWIRNAGYESEIVCCKNKNTLKMHRTIMRTNNYFKALWCPGDDHFVIQGDYFGKHFLGPSKSGSPGVCGNKVCVIREALGCFLAPFWGQTGSREAPQIELFDVKSFQNLYK